MRLCLVERQHSRNWNILHFFLYFKLIKSCLILRFKYSLKNIWQFWSFFSLLLFICFCFFFKCWHCVLWKTCFFKPKKFSNFNFFICFKIMYFSCFYILYKYIFLKNILRFCLVDFVGPLHQRVVRTDLGGQVCTQRADLEARSAGLHTLPRGSSPSTQGVADPR